MLMNNPPHEEMPMKKIVVFAAVLVLTVTSLAIADEQVQFNMSNRRAEQAKEVDNDLNVV